MSGWESRQNHYRRHTISAVKKPRLKSVVAALLWVLAVALGVYSDGPESLLPAFWFQLIGTLLRTGVLTAMALMIGVALLVGIRLLGKFPSELEKIGSDLSLYGHGVALSFFLGFVLGRPVLTSLGSQQLIVGFALLGLLTSYFFYGYNLYIAKSIRECKPAYSNGLEELTDLGAVFADPHGRPLLVRSLALGLFPTVVLIVADLSSR